MATGEIHFRELGQTQRLEAIGRFAGGIVHDFNNLLSVMLNYTTLILEELNAKDPIRADVEEIKLAAERASELTKNLLAFSRSRAPARESIDVNEVVAGLERMVRRIIGSDVTLAFSASHMTGFIEAAPAQLEQILMNLVVNARDAMPSGGALTIETRAAIVDDHDYAVITVTDTGSGMTEETCARVFEPFFTTKAPHEGTGLGLATVRALVDQLGGHIRVTSKVGIGTTFRVYFPKADAPADRPSTRATAGLPRGTETVLVVDDQDQVRACMGRTLRRVGYRVLEAADAEEALLVCKQHEGAVHLLLSEVALPRGDGRKLAERVRAARPDTRVLFTSAHVEASNVGSGVLPKPLTAAALTQGVRDVLDAE